MKSNGCKLPKSMYRMQNSQLHNVQHVSNSMQMWEDNCKHVLDKTGSLMMRK